METDPEALAMTLIASGLEPLDADARRRVLAWADSRFKLGATLLDALMEVGEELKTARQQLIEHAARKEGE